MPQSPLGSHAELLAATKSKLPSLTGLRFIAALAVFLFHTALLYSPIPPYGSLNPFADADLASTYSHLLSKGGYLGVSFFFVLSGFVLTWSFRPGERARAFWRRRLCKLFPNHVVTWALCMVLFAAAVTPLAYWLPNLLLVQSFSTDPFAWVSVNSPSWSLSSELLFYLLFPLFIVPILRIQERKLWAWAGATVAAILCVALVNHLVVPGPEAAPTAVAAPASAMQFWLGYFFPPARLFEFVLGMLLARIVLSGRWKLRIGVWPAAGLVVVAYGISLYLPYVFGFTVATVVPVAILIGAAATADIRRTRTVLRSRTMQWLGEVSFGFYMVQGIVLLYGRKLFDSAQYSTPVAIFVIIAFLAANIVAAWLLYTLVERPVMRHWSRSKKQTRPTSVIVRPHPNTDYPSEYDKRSA